MAIPHSSRFHPQPKHPRLKWLVESVGRLLAPTRKLISREGAWLFGMGLGAAQAAREDDFERARIAFVAFGVAVLLQLVALARYGGELDWSSVSGIAYLAVLLGVLALSVFGSLGERFATGFSPSGHSPRARRA